MTNAVSTYLMYANLQMAAEAIYRTDFVAGRIPIETLTTGNNRSSRFTEVQAQQFASEWQVVAHQPDTTTGFSGTVFQYVGEDDPSRGLVKNQLVMSFRSTEFADDAARDNESTNALEIKPFGWAFGQISDMRKWYESLLTSGKLSSTDRFAVTGYSLGGHLATAFNQLLDETGQAGKITSTYTFNGAGVGDITTGTLSEAINTFDQVCTYGADSLFQTGTAFLLYRQLSSTLNSAPTAVDLQSALAMVSSYVIELPPSADRAQRLYELNLLKTAIEREVDIRGEVDRVNAGISNSGVGGAAGMVAAENVEALRLDYQLAVLNAQRSTSAYRTGAPQSLADAYGTRNQRDVLENFYDIYGGTVPSAVSNSQWHYGSPTPIFIEDQPLYRGSAVASVLGLSLLYQDIKLLGADFSQNDFGDTHSLVLLVDSLSVQDLLATLDTSVSQATLNSVLNAASNAKAQTVVGGQGMAEGDVLESVFDGLRRMLLGPSVAPTPAKMAGGTWANIDDRNVFYANLKQLTGSSQYQSLVGKVNIGATAGDSGLPTRAHNEFTALVTLLTLSPVTLKVVDQAAGVAIEATLGNVWVDAYAGWLADKNLADDQRAAGQTNFTDAYFYDRQALLQAIETRNLRDEQSTALLMPAVGESTNFIDLKTGAHIEINRTTAPVGSEWVRTVTFGSDAAETVSGHQVGDRLYGGAGADTLNGLGGADYLEGNADNDSPHGGDGKDTLLGGAGADSPNGGEGEDTLLGGAGDDTLDGGSSSSAHDSLLGGAGTDTYTFNPGWGFDTVQDSDGLGAIVVTGMSPVDGVGATKVAEGSWLSADKKTRYTLVSVDAGGGATRSDLFISFTDRSDVIRIQGWAPDKGVGITLVDVVLPPVITNSFTGDIAKQSDDTFYTLATSGYASTGLQADAADVIIGTIDAEVLRGLGGNDGLSANAGDDLVEGGDGNDLLLGGLGTDTLNGGAGNDFIYGSAMGRIDTPTRVDFTPPVVASGEVEVARGFSWVAGRAAGPRWSGNTATFLGVAISGADAAPGFTATDGFVYVENTGNVIDAGAGNDYVAAGTAADTVHGGDDDDDIYGMGGADVLFGDAGSDFIKGDGVAASGMGTTTPDAAHGNDILVGGAGRDVLMGQGGDDELFGGTEDDLLWGDDTDATDTPLSIHGNDYLDGGDGVDRLEGGGKDDDLFGGAGNDSLWGDSSSVTTVPGAYQGKDYLDGEDGNDQLIGGGNDDDIYGGNGDDLIWGDDAKQITPLANQGRDYLDGEAGNDQVVGGGDKDTLFGGEGDDTLWGDDSLARVDLSAHGDDCLDGGAGKDQLSGSGGNDTLLGGEGDDVLWGDQGNDRLEGGAGNDWLAGEDETSATEVSTLTGNDTLEGAAGADSLVGGNGNDWLDGGADDDVLVGGAGADTLRGGGGADYLDGGAGDDTYVLSFDDLAGSGGRASTIADAQGSNRLELDVGRGEITLLANGVGGDLIVAVDSQHAVFVTGGLTGSLESVQFADGLAGMDRLIGEAYVQQVVSTAATAGARVYGGTAADTLSASSAAAGATLSGGRGDDTIELGAANGATMLFSVGDGVDHVKADYELGSGPRTGENVLKLGAGLALADLQVTKLDVGQYSLKLGAAGDAITFAMNDNDVAGAGSRPFDRIEFSDATQATWQRVLDRGIDVLVPSNGGAPVAGTNGADRIVGNDGDDTLLGGVGNDALSGADGNDVVDGGDGIDVLFGGTGNDTLISDGRDYLDGGAGDDTYRISGVTGGWVATLDDAAGTNTVCITGANAAASQVFAQNGQWYLATGLNGVLALGANAALGGLVLKANESDAAVSLQSIVDQGSADGLVRSGRWNGSSMTYTRSVSAAQTILGGGRAEWLEGGAGIDQISGGGGNDRVDGGAGADMLDGGAGADVIRGGRGDDSLAAATASGPNDLEQDVFVFARGDGTDFIQFAALPDGAAKDIIRFDAGIARSDISVSAVLSSDAPDGVPRLTIAYGGGDRIALDAGAEGTIASLEFADGTSMSMAEVIALLPPAASGGPVATEGDDFLVGTAGVDNLRGSGGNDTLQGGAGNDILQGGSGRNTYVFSNASGHDLIGATPNEQATLVFAGVNAADATTRMEGDNLVVAVGSESSVQVLGFAALGAAAQTWSVQFGAGAPVPVTTLLAEASQAGTLADRRGRFLAQQERELLTLQQRPFGYGGAAASTVTTQSLQTGPDGGFVVLPNYLSESEQTTQVTTSRREPIYEQVNPLPGNTVGGQQFLPLHSIQGAVPAGAVAVFDSGPSGQMKLIGYFVETSVSAASTVPRVVGYRDVAYVQTYSVAADTATQLLVTGSAGDDDFYADWVGQPAQFRGTIDAGAGNDLVFLNSTTLTWNMGEGYSATRVLTGSDWAPVNESFATPPLYGFYERGLGAWVDAGDGNDLVYGTDAADTVIGGQGSDTMGGGAGADSYIIGRESAAVDVVDDRAAFPRGVGDLDYFLDYGGRLDNLHQDTIEFDASVDRSRASYKWVPGTQSGNSTLELYQDGELFLQVTYAGDGSAGLAGSAGVERFVFSDGQVLSLAELRMALPEFTAMPPAAPELRQPLADITVDEDTALLAIDLASAFADPQGQPLSYTVAAASGQALPAWLQFNASTAAITGLPGNDDVGTLGLIVLATNASGLTTQDRFDITVTNVNDAPQLTGQPPGPVIVEEGATCVRAIDWFHDVDAGDTLSLSVAATDGSPLPPWVQFDPATKTLSAVPPLGALGPVKVRVTATDTGGLSATTDLVIDVQASAPRVLTGTAAADLLQGHSGNDSLDGGAGNDTLVGARGDDVYAVDSSLDMVIEQANEGVDVVQSSVSFVLGSNVENLTLTGASAIKGTGNSLDNVLVGNNANNALTGAAGNDTLDGGQGGDSLIGGAGNDTYVVDSSSDTVTESASAGTDLVLSSVTWALGSNVENLTLTGTAAINATGNSLGNVLTGNSAANTLSGGTGADTMIGGNGDDTYVVNSTSDVVTELADEGLDVVLSGVTLVLGENIESLVLTGVGNIRGTGNALNNALLGNAGNNTLSGGAGADSMAGGAGNDTYVVDDVADVVTELANEGVDLIQSGVTYALSANTENLTLTGAAAVNGTGNERDNTLTGNSANNVLIGGEGRDFLNGGAGIDTMFGGAGDDTYVVNLVTDVVTELADEGIDLVQTSVTLTLGANLENLLLTGTANRNGTGNTIDNVITGNSGNNSLSGLAGNDTLVGGTGNDTYVMGRGYGAELVQENDATAGNADVMQFLSGVASDQIWFRQVSNDLEVSIIGTTDKVLVQNWYLGSQYHVEQFKTSDGKTLLDSKVQDLVSAMASFTPPAAGQTTLSSGYQTTLLPIIAADWGP